MRIDFHFHYVREERFLENALKSMDEAEVEKALLVPFPNYVFDSIGGKEVGGNEEVLQVVKTHPKRFIGCIYIDPRENETIDTINKYFQEGFKCIKMHPTVGYYPNDPRLDPVYERISDLGLPILIHGGWTESYCLVEGEKRYTDSRFAQPVYMDYPARTHPKINFVVAHIAQPFFLDAYSLADHNPNVYFDLCLRHPQKDILAKLCENVNIFDYIDPNRLIWGTDNMISHRESIQENIHFLRRVGILDKYHEAIFGGTAAKILSI